MPEARQILSVTAVTEQIKHAIENGVGSVWVEGEISGAKTTSAGHCYFALKDEHTLLNAVLFSGAKQRGALGDTRLEDGQRVRVFGEISVYGPAGRYQLYVRSMEPVGLGELMLKFEALKQKLNAEGLFDRSRKPPLPSLARRIGVVTSPTGAVIHDILTVLGRRYPDTQVLLAPVKVQGEGAATSIAHAIRFFNERYGAGSAWPADLLIVGRGGGSLEDLWAFNEEAVVRAVAESRIPVISSVGHETDTTLCDLAATRRAATPSVAAELAVPRKSDLEEAVAKQAHSLRFLLEQRVQTLTARLDAVKGSAFFRHPARMAEPFAQCVDTLEMRVRHSMEQRGQSARHTVVELENRLSVVRGRWTVLGRARIEGDEQALARAATLRLERLRQRIRELEGKLGLLNPLAILDRGYSVTHTEKGKLVHSVADVAAGDTLITRVSDGEIRSHL